MRKGLIGFIAGVLIGIVILPVCAFFYIQLGYAPVATAAAPFPLEKRLATAALRARIKREAPKNAPAPASEGDLQAGAQVYREYCAVCHGTSAGPKTATARGMYPRPPQLFTGKGVTDDPVGETYWKIANGIRLTGMPAYGQSLSTQQVWQVSQLLAQANHLPPAVTNLLNSEPPAK